MSKYAVMPLSDYVDTCDVIREKTQNPNAITSSEMPMKVREVFYTGANEGYTAGYNQGEGDGYEKGRDSGYKTGYADGYQIGLDQGLEGGKYNYIGELLPYNQNLQLALQGYIAGDTDKEVMEQATADINAIEAKIEEKGVSVDSLTPSSAFPEKIEEVYEAGHDDGVEDGKTEAYEEIQDLNAELEQTLYGTDAGGKSFYDEFWDNFQDNGKKVYYDYAFAEAGNGKNTWVYGSTFNPKHPIKPKSAQNMFTSSALPYEAIKLIDFSECTIFSNIFIYCSIVHFPSIDIRKATRTSNLFAWNGKLEIIDELLISETTTIQTMFTSCTNLREVRVNGTIGQNGFNVQQSTKLSHDSLMSIINALKDNSGTDTWNSITLGAENLAKLTDAERKLMDSKQWEYA